jgi:hypothetical protein
MSSGDKKIHLVLDVETAFRLDELLRDALVAAGSLPASENQSVRPEKISLTLDDKTAAFFSDILRDGLIEAGAAHEANNISVAAAIKKIKGE